MELFKPGRVYDFMRVRRYWITLSLFLTLGSIVLLLGWPGPNYGTDFRGGTEIEVAFKKKVDPSDVRHSVTSGGFSEPDVVEVQDPNHASRFLIRVQEISTVAEATKEGLKKALCLGYEGVAENPACP